LSGAGEHRIGRVVCVSGSQVVVVVEQAAHERAEAPLQKGSLVKMDAAAWSTLTAASPSSACCSMPAAVRHDR
jgi:hypothetical protein